MGKFRPHLTTPYLISRQFLKCGCQTSGAAENKCPNFLRCHRDCEHLDFFRTLNVQNSDTFFVRLRRVFAAQSASLSKIHCARKKSLNGSGAGPRGASSPEMDLPPTVRIFFIRLFLFIIIRRQIKQRQLIRRRH